MELQSVEQSLSIDQIQEENIKLKAQLKRQEELYENSHMELLKWMVESEKQAQELKKLNQLLRKAFLNTIEIIQNIIEIKDPGSKDHSIRVSEAARFIALKVGEKLLEAEKVAVAARIHEIGKIAIPDAILVKNPEDLSETELKLKDRYPVLGAACVEEIPHFQEIARIIRHQKEKYNGSGKPDGLAGDEIPLGSRIIAMADLFDTVYFQKQKFDSAAQALNYIRQELNRSLDARLFPHLYAYVMENYSDMELPEDRKISFQEMEVGMVLSRDLVTISNVLLLPRNTRLNQILIDKILKHQNIDPIQGGIYVFREEGET